MVIEFEAQTRCLEKERKAGKNMLHFCTKFTDFGDFFGSSAICTEKFNITEILIFPGISQRIFLNFSEMIFEKLEKS